jgi:hypothetical protein
MSAGQSLPGQASGGVVAVIGGSDSTGGSCIMRAGQWQTETTPPLLEMVGSAVSGAGSIKLTAGEGTLTANGSIDLVTTNSGGGANGAINFVTNGITYVWPNQAVPSIGDTLKVQGVVGSTVTLEFSP